MNSVTQIHWFALLAFVVIPIFLVLFIFLNGLELLQADREGRKKIFKEMPFRLMVMLVIFLLLIGGVLPFHGHILIGFALLFLGIALAWSRWWWPMFVELLKTMAKAIQACDDQMKGKL